MGGVPMQSDIIGKINKAKMYAEEPERVSFLEMAVNFQGKNDTHMVSLKEDKWSCTCSFFETRGFCCHTLAMEKILEKMLKPEDKVNFSKAENA